MCGELTDRDTMERVNECLEQYTQDQFEILLYKKNRAPTSSFTLYNYIMQRRTASFCVTPALPDQRYVAYKARIKRHSHAELGMRKGEKGAVFLGYVLRAARNKIPPSQSNDVD